MNNVIGFILTIDSLQCLIFRKNDQDELTNRVLLNGLNKKIISVKSEWAELLNKILWTYKFT
jgi:hypothetical protein